MSRRKIVLQDHDGEPWWFLDGKPLHREHVILHRGGLELHGVFDSEGEDPPGEPGMEYMIEGSRQKHRVVIDPATDELRRPTDDEAHGGPFPIKTQIQ